MANAPRAKRKRKVIESGTESPAARARDVLLTLAAVEHSESTYYDPWPLAEAETAAAAGDSAAAAKCVDLGEQYEAADEAHGDGPLLRSPFMKLNAALKCIEELRPAIQGGEAGAILEAVAQCAAHGMVIPGWLAYHFLLRYQAVATGEARDWSSPEAFGPALPPGVNVAGVRAKKVEGPWAYEVAINLLKSSPHRAIDKGFFEEVGESIGKGATTAEHLIKEHVQASDRCLSLKKVKEALQKGKLPADVYRQSNDEKDGKFYRGLGFVLGQDGGWSLPIGPEKT